jgi:predicted lipoprotein with Yx(FWY)xxD motif
MKRLLILSVSVAAAVLALAACGGGGDYSSDAAVPPDGNAATVSTQQIGDEGAVLVDSAGQALYAADQETAAGAVLCTDDCTSFWVPLTVSDASPTGDGLAGELGSAERPDGTRQGTYDGKLLYSFVQDEPGEVTGEGFEDAFDGQTLTWHVVHADGTTNAADDGDPSTGPFGY